MKKYKFKINGNDYEVEVKDFENGTANIEVNGTCYQIEVDKMKTTTTVKPKTPILVRSSVPKPNANESNIQKNEGVSVKSPLPGTIVKILVKVGDTVKEGDKLLTMEAMKMENNVLAESGGVISKIHITEAQTVLQNDTLITIS